MFRVFKQLPPIPTGQRFTRYDSDGQLRSDEWHAANFKEIGRVSTWAQAKALTPRPIMESVPTGD